MAKKSSFNRQRPASHAKGGAASKTRTAARQASAATLVRAPRPDSAEPDSATPTSSVETPLKPSASSIVRDVPAASTKPAAKATTPAKVASAPAPAAPATKPAPAASKRQDTRVARARATQRARQAGLISAENYAYVIGDLKLVLGLAIGAFAILIVLTFVLPQ